MSNWTIKSAQNLECANKMIETKRFSSSVHCAYYADLQMIKHILHLKLNKPEQQFKGKDSHKELINAIIHEVSKYDIKSVNWLNNTLRKLKKLRILADYKNKLVYPDKAKEAFEDSGKIINYLKNVFNEA